MIKPLAVAGALLTALPALAADVTWTPGPDFGGPLGHEGILTNGTLVDAVHLASSNTGSITVVTSGLDLVFRNVNSLFFNTGFTDPANNIGDANWAAVIRTFEWNGGGDVDAPAFLDGLTVGNTYQVQFFSGRSHTCCASRTLFIGDGQGHLSAPVSQAPNAFQSVVATFVADATTQRFIFDDTANNPSLSAYVLRNLSPVPEPGEWALMLMGLAVVGRLTRRLEGR